MRRKYRTNLILQTDFTDTQIAFAIN